MATKSRSISLPSDSQSQAKQNSGGNGHLPKSLQHPKLLTNKEITDFNSKFAEIVQVLTENEDLKEMGDTNKWLARVLEYNVPHGKKNRGVSTAQAYKFMAKDRDLTDQNMQLSYVLGWCAELLQAYFLVSDDIMDHSETRRGAPCWYKVDNLGPVAFNDACLLESSIYVLLAKYFSGKPSYTDLLDVMHDITMKTVYGQSLDTRTGLQRNMKNYSMDLYSAIVKYKTSYYSFTLPVLLAMAMAELNEPDLRRQATSITLEMGHYFQVQDDYLDCFGDESVTGKIGTDIQDCKCSWLFVIASQRVDEAQRKILHENYGKQDPDAVSKVKSLYVEMGLPQTFKNYEEQTYHNILAHINQMSSELPKALFMDMIQKIYKRQS